jgi:hypothetical protein
MSWAICRRFLGDLTISAGVSFALSATLWAFLDSIGGAAMFIFAFTPLWAVPALVYAPFVIVVLYGVIRLRVGIVAGPVVLAAAAYVNSLSVLEKRQQAIVIAVPEVRAPLLPDHRVLALTGRSSSTQCEASCIRILATTEHIIALTIEPLGRVRWEVYTPAAGAICSATENAALAMEFLTQGFPDKCAFRTTAADVGDGLLLRKMEVDQYHRVADMPEGFHGTVYELHEQVASQDRLLARRIFGGLNPTGPHSLIAFEKGSPRIDSGPPLDERQFLASATKIPLRALFDKAHPFPFNEVLDGIEKFFGRKEAISQGAFRTIEGFAGYKWWGVALSEGKAHEADLRRHVVRLLTSTDEPRLTAVLNTIRGMPVDQRLFADDRLFDLSFDPRTAIGSRATSVLSNRFRGHQFPPSDELRARARARLGEAGLTPAQRELLTRISEF